MIGRVQYPPTLRSHLRATLAIAKKDAMLRLRYPLDSLFHVLQPIIWLTPLYFLGRSFATAGGNPGFAAYTGVSDYMSFVLLGTILSNFVQTVFWGMGYALKNEMDLGVLESNWLVTVPRPLFLVGQTVASLAITTATSAAVLLLGHLLFGFEATGSVVTALLAVVPVLIALYGFGFAFAGLVLLMRDSNTLVDVSSYVVMILSGSNFPVQALPGFLLPLALALPLTYGNDALRGSLLHTRTILPLPVEIGISLAFMVVMTFVGATVFRLVERRCRTLGTLALH
jgi:ABC-2 type transport system permease protein